MALSGADIKKVMQRYHERLRRHREDLNRLNVYPVPDGDTGDNMAATVDSVIRELQGATSMPEIATAIAHGALMGGAGNSGVILSQILRGMSDVIRDSESVGVHQLADALDRASDAAYRAVMRPVEGTILTVLREAADAAAETATPQGTDLSEFLTAVYERAADSLQRTPELLPVLKEAGVVDAGGAGFLLLIAAFLEEVSGRDVSLPAQVFRAAALVTAVPASGAGEDVSDLRYEVMFFLDADDAAIDGFRAAWEQAGDSIVVVGGDGTYNCHIHTDDVGAAIEAGIAVGRPHQIKVTDLQEQAAERAFHHGHGGADFAPLPEFTSAAVGVVPVAVGDGVVDLFRGLGAQGVVRGGQTMNPSLADVLAVVEGVAADTVILLPNNKNVILVAEQVDGATAKTVIVVPTRNVPQGLAAMLAYRPDVEDGAALAAAMADAATAVRSGELTRAVRAAKTPVGPVAEGDWLGIADGDVALVDQDEAAAMRRLLDHLIDGEHEIVTVLRGDGAVDEVLAAAGEWLDTNRPGVELEVVPGGQPLYPYLLSVE